jgi:hypothetical protein
VVDYGLTGDNSVKAWGINFAVATTQDAFVKEPIKVFIIHIMLLGIMKPQLLSIKRTLQGLIIRYTIQKVDNAGDFRVVQVNCRSIMRIVFYSFVDYVNLS